MFRADAAKVVATFSLRAVSAAVFVFSMAQLLAVPAFADDAVPGGGPSPLMQFVPIIVMVGVMYFLMIRPQAARAKTHQTFVSSLKRGDEVVTASGILGRIEGLTDQFVTLEVAPGVRIKILRSQIATAANAAINATTKEVNT